MSGLTVAEDYLEIPNPPLFLIDRSQNILHLITNI